ncbi:hypothetical protein DSO57_1035175 [Entomophthora muscae]|uniref:Uncharacterized protein n=1 Tax=Entomophthora muscae TaxID=34485 RepID=A0ACC2REF5_9FUNG|nr:hypothetical protein DSO57_1035175 [Entomophthora muscae]
MKFVTVIGLLLAQVDAEVNVQQLVASKEALVVKTSYAGCCGRSSRCESCNVKVSTKLQVGNYHYRGNAIMSYHVDKLRNSSTCRLVIPKQSATVVGSSVINIQRSLSSDFNVSSISWKSSPELGKVFSSIDLEKQGTVDLTELCQEAAKAQSPVTFFFTPGFAPSTIELPSSKSNTPITLQVTY